MNEEISTLMDGELERDEAARLIKSLGSDSARRADWETYHLIGACLRGEYPVSGSRSCARDELFKRLAEEPTVIAPGAMARRMSERRTRIALAMAASLVTVSAVTAIALKQQAGSATAPVQLVQKSAPALVVQNVAARDSGATAMTPKVNDYLILHRQFAYPSGFQNAALVQPAADPANRAAGR
jgi:sigma-E factor negative regulatory protein RseA